MIGVVIVTHGNFSEEILKSAELIVGKQEKVIALTLNYGDDVEELKEKIRESILEVDNGQGVVVLTDVFGSSPSNATCFNMKKLKFRAVTGINMPMLLELFSFRKELELDELIRKIILAGKDGIIDLHNALGTQP